MHAGVPHGQTGTAPGRWADMFAGFLGGRCRGLSRFAEGDRPGLPSSGVGLVAGLHQMHAGVPHGQTGAPSGLLRPVGARPAFMPLTG